MASPTKAWNYPRSHLLFWVIVGAALAGDLASKWAVFRHLPDGEAVTVVSGFLEFKTVHNRGAVFGLGKGHRWVFVVATFVAMFFLLHLFAKSRANQRFLHGLLALSLSGALGNLYDRVMHGVVRDFIHITAEIHSIPLWPAVFNVADIALVIGIGVLLAGWTFNFLEVQGVRASAEQTDTCGQSHENTERVDRS